MSDASLARRTEVSVKINGINISADINKYLLQLTYTDHEEDKTDDLQINLDDREGIWLTDWLGGNVSETDTSDVSGGGLKIRNIVNFTGGSHYASSDAETPTGGSRTPGKATLTIIEKNAPHPYHLVGITSNVYGWVNEEQIQGGGAAQENAQEPVAGGTNGNAKGAEISAAIIQKNWESDGKDRVLDCGIFEIDSLSGSGPPAGVSIKATSLPYSSTVRTEKKTKAWENIKLSAIASEIANKNGMTCMFESSYDPLYTRRE